MSSEAVRKAVAKYQKKTIRQIPFRLNVNTDKDILAHLENLDETRNGYLKRLVREDIERIRCSGCRKVTKDE